MKDQQPIAILCEAPQHRVDSEPSVEELAKSFRQFRRELQTLTESQQQEVWNSLHDRTESISEQTLYQFFAHAPADQEVILDRTIDRIDARRREWYERNWQGRTYPVREVSNQESRDRPFVDHSMEERLAVRRDMWEDATPQAQAMRGEFYRLMAERRRQRGLPEWFRRNG